MKGCARAEAGRHSEASFVVTAAAADEGAALCVTMIVRELRANSLKKDFYAYPDPSGCNNSLWCALVFLFWWLSPRLLCSAPL